MRRGFRRAAVLVAAVLFVADLLSSRGGTMQPGFVPLDRVPSLLRAVPHPAAAGCPRPPEVCTLGHVFDLVLVIGLDRLSRRALAVSAQLSALGAPHAVIAARDGLTDPEARERCGEMAAEKERTPGVWALWASMRWLLGAVGNATVSTPDGPSVLILEDDAVLHADFPRAFDASVRRVPADWQAIWLGATLMHDPGINATLAAERGLVQPARVFGAHAVGFRRGAAAAASAGMAAGREPLDVGGFEAVLKAFPGRCHALWPALVATDPYPGSTLNHTVAMSAAVRTTLNGVERDWFAFSLGGYRRGAEAGTEVVQGGRTDGVAYEAAVRRAASVPDYLGPEASPDACAAACASDWPRCKAWTWSRRASGADALPACSFVPRLGGGELVPAPAAVSGTVVERDRQPGSRVWTDRARSRADGRGKKAAGAGIA